MTFLVVNVLLMLTWAADVGQLHPSQPAARPCRWRAVAVVGARAVCRRPPPRQSVKLLVLTAVFFKELSLSAIKVALLVIRPNMQLRPGISPFR